MRRRPPRAALATALSLVVLAGGCASGGDDPAAEGSASGSASATAGATRGATPTATPTPTPGTSSSGADGAPQAPPALDVRRVVRDLAQPWDVAVLPGGELLVTERDTGRLLVTDDGGTRALDFPSGSVWVSGETGLMSLAVAPGFARNRRVYTCQGGFTEGGGTDVRVVAWRLDEALTRATRSEVLLSGLPTSTGRHGGCRLLLADDGALLVGTGDAAQSENAQDLGSLGGKVLRIDPATGAPWPGNPWADHPDRERRLVLTYGHRNVQGLAQRDDGSLWAVEHGSDRDDEVNLLVPGGDYGWDPGPGYDESVPMTDQSLPGAQQDARWASGYPTIATSGAAWVRGEQWGGYDGTLAVAALKGEQLVFLRFDDEGRLLSAEAPPALQQDGRLRSVTRAPDGDLLVTTANGSDDAVLRVSPR